MLNFILYIADMKKWFLFIITLLLGLMPMAIFAQENTESLDLACNDKFEIQGPT